MLLFINWKKAGQFVKFNVSFSLSRQNKNFRKQFMYFNSFPLIKSLFLFTLFYKMAVKKLPGL